MVPNRCVVLSSVSRLMYSLGPSGVHTTKDHPAGTLSFYVVPAHADLILRSGPYISKDVDRVMDQRIKGCIMAFCFIFTKSDSKQSLSGSHYATRCLYQGVDDPLPCYEQITHDDVAVHMKRIHGIGRISRRIRIKYPWSDCALSTSRHNFVRHTREVHLGYERK